MKKSGISKWANDLNGELSEELQILWILEKGDQHPWASGKCKWKTRSSQNGYHWEENNWQQALARMWKREMLIHCCHKYRLVPATMDVNMGVLENRAQLCQAWAHTQSVLSQHATEMLAQPCLLLQILKHSESGTRLDVHQQMNQYRKCRICIQWDFTWPCRKL